MNINDLGDFTMDEFKSAMEEIELPVGTGMFGLFAFADPNLSPLQQLAMAFKIISPVLELSQMMKLLDDLRAGKKTGHEIQRLILRHHRQELQKTLKSIESNLEDEVKLSDVPELEYDSSGSPTNFDHRHLMQWEFTRLRQNRLQIQQRLKENWKDYLVASITEFQARTEIEQNSMKYKEMCIEQCRLYELALNDLE